jgi:enamine deaminase RidA (YjgF/YER057c/UK114 family)
MRSVLMGLLAALVLVSCAQNTSTKITRYTLNPWEKDIGYAAVVQAGNTYHISGVTCGGPNYQSAVPECYKELQNVLSKLGLMANNIVKENVYALDIEKFKEQIEERKKFYGNTDYPAATWVQIDRLYSPEHLVEIELIAVK